MNPLKSQIAANRERFEKELSVYTNEYGYVHKIPNYDKIKSFLTTSQTSLLQTAIDAVEEMKVIPDGVEIDDLDKYVFGVNETVSKVVELLKGGIE